MTHEQADNMIRDCEAASDPYTITRFGNMADPPETATYEVRGPGLSGGHVVAGCVQAQRWAMRFASVFVAGRRAELADQRASLDKVFSGCGAD